VQDPDDLVRVADGVRRELRRDRELDRASVRLLEVEQAPEERLREDALARVPLERDGHEVDLVRARTQLRHEIVGEDLRAAALERHLGGADGDPHPRIHSPSSAPRVYLGRVASTSRPVAAEAIGEGRTRV
jgi:hypothetical protein